MSWLRRRLATIAAITLTAPVVAVVLAAPASATSYFTCSPEDYHINYSTGHWEWYTYQYSEVIDVPQHIGYYVYRRHYDHWTYWYMLNPVTGAPVLVDNHQALTCTTS
ncbi:hypothetical protein [Microbispora catharanthi]|uniref:Secreted protein n=1 Tax=Microbispora catharanthi TaxID=1712871 RepID=A0A5N6BN44_9ACTN|nr:hypothetical protein [Microbispora catharanthi]KAB8181904.1 hypothetical protein FH610_026075 [Microbispora catharanthi]